MRDFCKILVLFLGLYGFSQEKLTYIDSDNVFSSIDSLNKLEKINEVLELIGKINVNDSIYWPMQINNSYYLLNQKEYKKSIEVADSGLKHNDPQLNETFYTNKAVALYQLKQTQDAIITLEKGLKEYPSNHIFYQSIGGYYESLEKYELALEAYKTSAWLNPFNEDIHLKIGNLFLKKRMTAQALMCFNTYLMLNPDGSSSFSVLKSLNNVFSQDNQTQDIRSLTIEENNDQFEELNMILDNRVALQEGYESGNEINISLTKQNHVLLSYIEDFEANPKYLSNNYLELFQWISKNDLFDEFTYTISYSIENEKLKKIVDENHDAVVDFYQQVRDEIAKIYNAKRFEFNGFSEPVHASYANNQLDGIGPMAGGMNKSDWVFYDGKGRVKMNGQYDTSGKRTGKWTMIYPNGSEKESAVYKSGNLHGENKVYYENGAKKYICYYENDTLNGPYTFYSQNGAITEKKNFHKGNLSGEYISYHDVGEQLPKFAVSYKDGYAEGVATETSPNGETVYSVTYKKSKKTGVEKSFYDNGNEKMLTDFENGVQNGKKIEFYNTGSKKSEANMIEDNYEGVQKIFYPNGSIKQKYEYADYLQHGPDIIYYSNGEPLVSYDYRKGELIGYKFFSSTGEVLKEARKKGGQFYYEGYSKLGQIEAKGLYDVEGGKTGEWLYFSENGAPDTKEYYLENVINNERINYYENGSVLSISNYQNGDLEGYYVSYFKNGKIESQGYYKNGNQDKEWRSYYMDGTLKSILFFHKGSQHGEQHDYSVEGKLVAKYDYQYGRLIGEEHFDQNQMSKGIIDWSEPSSNDIVQIKFANGTINTEFSFLNNIKHGPFIEKDALGVTVQKGSYINGKAHGKWQVFFPNGNLKIELNFVNGLFDGSYKTFYENGNLQDSYNYVLGDSEGTSVFYGEDGKTEIGSSDRLNGEAHGKRIFRDHEGNIQLIRYYEHGTLLGYSYLDKDGNEVALIPLNNETGKIKSFYKNGNVAREMEYINGNLTNAYTSYYYDGTLHKEHTYWHDENHGIAKVYFPSGKIKEENSYAYGSLEGVSKKYYKNGNLRETSNYKNDEKSGETIIYDEAGTIERKDIYFNGTRIKSTKNGVSIP